MEGIGSQAPPSPGKYVTMASDSRRGCSSPAFISVDLGALTSWPDLPWGVLHPEVASDGLCFPSHLDSWDLPSSFTFAVSSPAGALWRGWDLGLRFYRQKPVDSPILHPPGPVALHL